MLTIAHYMEIAISDIIDLVEYEGWSFQKALHTTLRQFTDEELPHDTHYEIEHTAWRKLYW